MPNITDSKFAALRSQGYTGSISDMMLQWLQANGATSNSIPDAWREVLVIQGYGLQQRNDDWFALLGDLGYTTGSLNDRAAQFWLDGGELYPTTFYAPLKTSVVATGLGDATAIFTRSLTPATVEDHEGVVQTVKEASNEARFAGARRVRNIATDSNDFSNATDNIPFSCTLTHGKTDPAGGTSATEVELTMSGGGLRFRSSYVASNTRGSIWVKAITDQTGNGLLVGCILTEFFASDRTDISNDVIVGEWVRVSHTVDVEPFSDEYAFAIAGGPVGSKYQIAFMQIEDYPSINASEVSENVSTADLLLPFHGAYTDGVKYFETRNGNSNTGSVVNNVTGARILPDGFLIEEASTELCPFNRDLSDASWTLSDITVTRDQVGVDGKANTACLLTATAPSAFIARVITSGPSLRCLSLDIKRVNGSGAVWLYIAGQTALDCTSLINDSTFTRCYIAYPSTTDPTIAVAISDSGDSIVVDYFSCRTGATETSRIETTGATTVIRNTEYIDYNTAGNFPATNVELSFDFTHRTNLGTSTSLQLFYSATTTYTNEFNILYVPATGVVSVWNAQTLLADATITSPVVGEQYTVKVKATAAEGLTLSIVGHDVGTSPATTTLALGTKFYVGRRNGSGVNGNTAFRNLRIKDLTP